MKICPTCQKQILNTLNKYCDHSCAAKATNKLRAKYFCSVCNTPTHKKHQITCSFKCANIRQNEIDTNNFKLGLVSARTAKRLLLLEGSYCHKCKNTNWLDQPIPLELEHIDGNSENNNPKNLELLCPNCHALTPTYKNKNKGNGRHKRRQRYVEGKSY